MSEGRQPPKSPTPRPRAPGDLDDEVEYGHRHFLNLVSAAFLLVLALAMTWTVQAFDKQESLRKCFASGRKDCVQIAGPPRGMVQAVR